MHNPKVKRAKPEFLRLSSVRTLVRSRGKRSSHAFEMLLDALVKDKIERACAVHNGGKITLDATVAAYVGAIPKGY